MAFYVGNPILASELIAIKARVKAEMLRRDKIGSLVQYGSSEYDYTVTPTDGNPILPEHFNKLIVPMNAMVDTGLTQVSKGDPTPALGTLDALLTEAEGYNITGATTNCRAECSGLCAGTCSTTCGVACSGSCSGSCSGGCEQDCKDDCYTGCKNTCKSTCSTECAKNCGNNCTDYCQGGCKGTCFGCSNTCKDTCSGTCKSSCIGQSW